VTWGCRVENAVRDEDQMYQECLKDDSFQALIAGISKYGVGVLHEATNVYGGTEIPGCAD
jgi:hypothetical protein